METPISFAACRHRPANLGDDFLLMFGLKSPHRPLGHRSDADARLLDCSRVEPGDGHRCLKQNPDRNRRRQRLTVCANDIERYCAEHGRPSAGRCVCRMRATFPQVLVSAFRGSSGTSTDGGIRGRPKPSVPRLRPTWRANSAMSNSSEGLDNAAPATLRNERRSGGVAKRNWLIASPRKNVSFDFVFA
jgi:hypothetical protein